MYGHRVYFFLEEIQLQLLLLVHINPKIAFDFLKHLNIQPSVGSVVVANLTIFG